MPVVINDNHCPHEDIDRDKDKDKMFKDPTCLFSESRGFQEINKNWLIASQLFKFMLVNQTRADQIERKGRLPSRGSNFCFDWFIRLCFSEPCWWANIRAVKGKYLAKRTWKVIFFLKLFLQFLEILTPLCMHLAYMHYILKLRYAGNKEDHTYVLPAMVIPLQCQGGFSLM